MKRTSSILAVSLAAVLLPAVLPVRAQTFAPGQIRISAVVNVQFETLSGTGK